MTTTESRCPRCGQVEPVDTDHARLMRARHSVFEAWKKGPYAERLGASIGFFDAAQMVDDAIAAVRSADAESDELSAGQGD